MTLKFSFLLLIIAFILAGEVILREEFGFCNAVLVKADNDFEYIAQENQDRVRFGNRVFYNEFSMRSDRIDSAAIKILGLGDSVLNGGVAVDQENLVTSILSKELWQKRNEKIQVLNISYKSWGPDNADAYLQKYGTFKAKAIFLVVSSHDAFDTMDFKIQIGRDKNYPTVQYSLAYSEAIDRYLLPRIVSSLKPTKAVAADNFKRKFNPGFQNLLNLSRKKDIPLIIYLHPEISEISAGDYNNQGKMIIDFAQRENIPLIQGIEDAEPDFYMDHIHLKKEGHLHISRRLYPELEKILR